MTAQHQRPSTETANPVIFLENATVEVRENHVTVKDRDGNTQARLHNQEEVDQFLKNDLEDNN